MREADRLTVGVFTAAPEELLSIRTRFEGDQSFRQSSAGIWRVSRHRVDILMTVTGDGPQRAGTTAAAFLREHRPDLVIGAGVAGALSSNLKRASLVIGKRIFGGERRWTPSPELLGVARETNPNAAAGTIIATSRLLWSASLKQEVFVGAGSPSDAVADMESAAWTAAAEDAGVPLVVLRSVLDEAGEALPEYLSEFVRADGSVDRARIARHALSRPSVVPGLLDLRSRVQVCSSRLADAIESLVRSLGSRDLFVATHDSKA